MDLEPSNTLNFTNLWFVHKFIFFFLLLSRLIDERNNTKRKRFGFDESKFCRCRLFFKEPLALSHNNWGDEKTIFVNKISLDERLSQDGTTEDKYVTTSIVFKLSNFLDNILFNNLLRVIP